MAWFRIVGRAVGVAGVSFGFIAACSHRVSNVSTDANDANASGSASTTTTGSGGAVGSAESSANGATTTTASTGGSGTTTTTGANNAVTSTSGVGSTTTGATGTGGSTTTGSSTGGVGGRGPTPPSGTANFPFPQNRESDNCVYATSYRNSDVRALYQSWKSDLVTSDGAGGFRRVARVAEPGLETNSTVSEGIGYGMLISVYMDDQALFDDLWKYALQYTWTYSGGFPDTTTDNTLLMNWYIHADGNISPGGGDDPAGNGAATDADEDMAFALVMADRQWGGQGSLDRAYIDYARDMIDDIWAYEIADERLPKNGSSWGSDTSLNISYFAPAYYRVFADVTGDDRWSTNVVDYIYQVIDNNLDPSRGNENNGLVPAWSQSNGDPAEVSAGQSALPYHYQYDSCRTPFRIGLDACWHGDSRATGYVAKTSQFFSAFGASGIVDGYELDGTPRPEFPDQFGGLSGAFIGPAGVGAMHDAAYSGFVDQVYSLLVQNGAWAGGQYYDESWIMMTALMMSGNFLDYTQYN